MTPCFARLLATTALTTYDKQALILYGGKFRAEHIKKISFVRYSNCDILHTNQIGLRCLTWPGTWSSGICWVLKISTYCWGCPILVSMNNRKYKHTLVFPQHISACEWLTLQMLNCFEFYKICIHILYHILDSVQQKKTKFIMEQPYMLPILYCQYHACWSPGDLRSQGISRHGINQISQNVLSLASE